MLNKNLREQNRIIHKLKLQYKQQAKDLDSCKLELNELYQRLKLEQDQRTTLQKLTKDNDKFRKDFCDEIMQAK
jgi:hypothetical protein